MADYHADTSKVPYILDEFTYFFENLYDQTDANFPECRIDRPPGASSNGRMYILNHMLHIEADIDLGFFKESIQIPDQGACVSDELGAVYHGASKTVQLDVWANAKCRSGMSAPWPGSPVEMMLTSR